MTTELPEDVVLITTPHLVTADGGGCGVGATPHRGPFSGSVELGRRLLLAARYGHTAQVLDLMAKGAPFTTDWLGTSPLHVAAYGAHAETCAVLLRAGVSRDSRTKVERTPLHLAAHAGHAGVASLLLERGALVDCSDMLRMTPLHWASERGHFAVVSVLLRYGADPRAISKFHKTPMDLAGAKGHHAILKLLEDAMKEREAADSVDALKQADADVHMTEIPAAEQQQALQSIERLQDTVKPANKTISTRTAQIKIELPEVTEVVPQSSVESGEDAGGGGAAALLREHGITLLPHDSSTTVLNALQSGRTVVLSGPRILLRVLPLQSALRSVSTLAPSDGDGPACSPVHAGKLMLKESSTPGPAPAPAPVPVPVPAVAAPKGVVLTAAPVRTPPGAGVKIFTLNNRFRAADKLPIKKIVNPQDMQIKLVSLPESKLSSPRKLPGAGVALKAKPRRLAAAGARGPVKIIMQKDNFQKMIGKATLENGVESGSVQITSSTDLGKVLQVSNATVAPTATIIGSTGVIGSTGNVFTNAGCVIGSTAGIINNTATVIGNSGAVTTPVVSNSTVSGSGFMCVPAEFLSSNSPAYLRSQLLSAHKTIHELNQQVTALKEQLAAYENI